VGFAFIRIVFSALTATEAAKGAPEPSVATRHRLHRLQGLREVGVCNLGATRATPPRAHPGSSRYTYAPVGR